MQLSLKPKKSLLKKKKKFLRLKPLEPLQRKRENTKKESQKERKSESMKKCAEFWDLVSIYRGWKARKNRLDDQITNWDASLSLKNRNGYVLT